MESEQALMPVFTRPPAGADETYDTLDNIDLGGNNTVEELYKLLCKSMEGTVGVCIAGNSALCDPNDGYWGRALILPTGEHMQVRICPRGSAGKKIANNESLMIATRRTSINSMPVVASVMVFMPRECSFVEGSTPMTSGSTIGCRGVHIVLPSVFSKHASLRDPSSGYASVDPEGYHSVRPSTLCIGTKLAPRSREDRGLRMSISPGFSYLTIAAHMFGVDLPDPLTRSAEIMSEHEHSRQIVAKQRRIVKSIGENKAGVAIAWNKVAKKGARAIDLALKSGYDNALLNVAGKEDAVMHLEDNLKFWQRVGQRTIAKLMGDPSPEVNCKKVTSTRFGNADLVDDPVSAANYACLAKEGFAKPVSESPIDKICLSPLADSRATLSRILDNVEMWLRTGSYGDHRLSKANVNVAKPQPGSAASDADEGVDADSPDDQDDLLDNKVCIAAVENASGAITVAMLHGAYVVHQFDIRAYLVSSHLSNECADCSAKVGVLQGTMFSSNAGQCRHCNRKRCFECTIKSMRIDHESKYCLRCAPGTPSTQLKAFQSKRGGKQ